MGSSFTGDPGRYVKKVTMGAPFQPRGTWYGGGSYTGDFDRQIKEGCGGGTSLCEGFHEGDLEGWLLYWGTRKMRFLRDMQNAL